MSTTLNFAKGHGTRNDFVIVTDRESMLPPTEEQVRWLCDRRAGIGADGLLRAVRARHIAEWDGDPDLWFMDYRNADGSIAEMCGNGLRVFVRYLMEEGLVDTQPVEIGTRAGLRRGWALPDERIRISMGPARVAAAPTWVRHDARQWEATTVDVGNPHAVVVLGGPDELAALDLNEAPQYDPAVYPAGVNFEFIVPTATDALTMRVHERGVGETQSCGTGVVAAAASLLAGQQRTEGTVAVRVPGGELEVEIGPAGVFLTGPAVVVARGSVVLPF